MIADADAGAELRLSIGDADGVTVQSSHLEPLFCALHADIENYCAYTNAVAEVHRQQVDSVIDAIRCIPLGHASSRPGFAIGSGAWLPSSDVDLVVIDAGEVGMPLVGQVTR